ncbi:LacI family DNA-binding transcriptional regulator [Flindersiella endophytica]
MATIADVARRAGVAPSTVSYVLSNRRSISESTRRAVEQAIEDLGYHPHAGARALRGARTRVLALSGPDVSGPYQAGAGRFVHHIAQAAHTHDHDLLLLTGEESLQGLRRVAGSRLADGAVLMSVLTDDPRIEVLRELRFPAALIGKPRDPHGLPWCDFDFEEAAATAVRELARAGHQTIAFLASSDAEFRDGLNYAPRAVAGARAAARAGGIRLSVVRSSNSHQTLVKRVRALLDADPAPTALVTHYHSPLLLSILREAGYDVPADISVVMVANVPDIAGEIPLARLELPVEQMTATAVDLAIGAVEGTVATTGRVSEHRLIPVRLTRGRSIAPPRS